MFNYKGHYVSYLILVCSVLIFFVFGLWLYKDTEVDKYIAYFHAYEKLLFADQREAMEKLRIKTLAEIADEKLDNIWLPLVEIEKDELKKIQLYSRILAGNPKDEFTYSKIAFLVNKLFPEGPQSQKRMYFLKTLQEIEDVNHGLLKKYNLITSNK